MFDQKDVTACACANLRKVTRMVTQAYDAALKQTGLKATQFTVLVTLDQTGELPVGQLAQELLMERTTLTRNLQPLIKKGYIVITSQKDQRVRNIDLTDDGRHILQEALPLWEKTQSVIVNHMGDGEFNNLLNSLKGTLEAVEHL